MVNTEEEEKVREAMRFHYILVGQAWILGFISAIMVSEIVPAFENLRVIPGLLLVFLLSRLFLVMLRVSNLSQYEEYKKVIEEYLKTNGPKR